MGRGAAGEKVGAERGSAGMRCRECLRDVVGWEGTHNSGRRARMYTNTGTCVHQGWPWMRRDVR